MLFSVSFICEFREVVSLVAVICFSKIVESDLLVEDKSILVMDLTAPCVELSPGSGGKYSTTWTLKLDSCSDR